MQMRANVRCARRWSPSGLRETDPRPKPYRYVGKIDVIGRSISLALTFPDLEFARLPIAKLLAPSTEAPNVVAQSFHIGSLMLR